MNSEMETKPTPTAPAPVVVAPVKPAASGIREDVLAWMSARTAEEKRAVLAKYPSLRSVYAEAAELR